MQSESGYPPVTCPPHPRMKMAALKAVTDKPLYSMVNCPSLLPLWRKALAEDPALVHNVKFISERNHDLPLRLAS